MYYNTTSLTNSELREAAATADNQDKVVEMVFKRYHKDFTPREVHNIILRAGLRPELTSTRRSIHTLKTKGILEETGEMRRGEAGRPERVLKLKTGQLRMF